MTCGVEHPDRPELHCESSGTHADHVAWTPEGHVFWANQSYVPPPPRETKARAAAARDGFLDAAKKVAPETRTAVDAPGVVVSHAAPDTSVDAADTEMPRSGTHRRIVYDAYRDVWPEGLTEDELVERTGLHINTARPRRWELVQQERLEDSRQRRLTAQGNDSIVWRLAPLGVEEHGLGAIESPDDFVLRDFG